MIIIFRTIIKLADEATIKKRLNFVNQFLLIVSPFNMYYEKSCSINSNPSCLCI